VTDFEYSRNHNDPASRETVQKAYELALNHIAQDKDSGDIWNDYIQFLKAADVRDLSSTLLSDDANGLVRSAAALGKSDRTWTLSAKLIIEPSKYLWTMSSGCGKSSRLSKRL
jgi:hypothetical protein